MTESMDVSVQGMGHAAAGSTQRLTDADLVSYHENGFVVPDFRLGPDETARLRGLILKLVADNPALSDRVMNSPHVPGSGVQGLKSPEGWMEFAAHPAVLDMIERILGPDIILWGTGVFYKRPSTGPATPWHRDATLLPIEPLSTMSVWIAVSDSFIDNACLRMIPGSHMGRTTGRHTQQTGNVSFGLTLDPSEYDEARAVDLELEAGQMVIFDGFTIHGSRNNAGKRERASMALRFMPAASRFNHEKTPDELRASSDYGQHTRPLILVRGVDRARNDFKRGHPV